MQPQAGDGMNKRRKASWSGFSLAELMIALAVLGMGLLVIAAALPAGVRYTKDSIDMSTGAAATEYALDVIEQKVCLRDSILDATSGDLVRAPALFQPRFPPGVLEEGQSDPGYEPLIKVRPLFTQNINAVPGGGQYGEPFYDENDPSDDVWGEMLISTWLFNNFGVGNNNTMEWDTHTWGAPPGFSLRPVIPSVLLVYPPISSDISFYPDVFFDDIYYARPVTTPATNGAETLKALERRVAWTAFYRRVSYASDPALYEFIVVATRRPSATHRYPLQAIEDGGMQLKSSKASGGYDQNGRDCGAAIPWLVTFQSWQPVLTSGTDYTADTDRFLNPNYVAPPTLTFAAGLTVGQLLPVGSVIIPAVNDLLPTLLGYQSAGFVPSAPDALPIYEVIEQVHHENNPGNPDDDTYDIIVTNNGFYPWTSDGNTWRWPVWVIPPAIDELVGPLGSQVPVYSDHSPILAVDRRYIQLTEIP